MFASTPTPKPGSSLLSSRDTPSSADDTTLVTYESVTSVLVTQLMPSAEMFKTLVHDSASTLTLTSTSTICATCKTTDTATPTTLSTSTISLFSAYNPLTSSSPSQPFSPSSPSCPEIVPRCINTWLDSVPKCSSNSDVSCFCPKSSFTNHVIGCIQSWAGSEEEVSAGIGYFVGICAGYVSENPGIVTGVPGSVSIAPVTGTATGDVSATAVSYGTRTLTVPEVSFTTDAAASASGSQVQLVPGAPATTLSSSATSTTSSTTQTPWSPTWITSTTSDGSSSATPSSTHTGRASKVEVGRGLGVGVVGVVFAGLLF
ncbi:CFEM domain-containing protein [Aspergillus chevalieri]|uniref:CFEM domain-containing protein n=1 Tax=Aspergillus chevalieri TaxID=182096 RepID=A0A7R7ZKN1_ASPCH|nr:uncharacterized protein ACHE_20227A [Aspergillus chevalieri]BCR84769.1 hypothetical protein ACHE_20227A [Aspergillus chevalieri]